MREILFRGKRKDNGKWVYGYYVCDETGQISEEPIAFIYHLNNHPCGWDLIPFEVIPETVGQFTGLTANGTKIFEGDILLVDNIQKVYVFFERGHFVVNHYAINLLCSRNIESEVIGNIHDNEFEDFENE